MTHYWWMHWFWITLCLALHVFVVCGHSLVTTSHSIEATDLPVEKNETSEASRNFSIIPPKTYSPVVLRNASSYAKNFSFAKSRPFSNKLKVLPLEVPAPSNATLNVTIDVTKNLNRNNTREFAVISQNLTDLNVTGFVFSNNNVSLTSGNQTENVTYLGDELNYNHSIVQSERIGIEEPDVDLSEASSNLSAAGITGITLGCVIVVGMICAVSFFIYHNQGFNKPQVLNDRCSNPDSSGYIDDASVRDNSEEMYSLDNDSFLNSLEAMTIQNYWTDTVKHTKL